jgi:hypothetical protein
MDKTFCIWAGLVASSTKWLLIVLAIFLITSACVSDKQREIRILFTGDIMLSRNVRLEIENRKLTPWINIGSRLRSSDLLIGNLEGSVGFYNHKSDTSSKAIIFDIPKSFIPLLKEAGFNAISLENNHSFDLGVDNKDSTIIEVSKAGIQPIWSKNSPRFFRFDKITISLIAINIVPDLVNHNEFIPSISIKQKLRLAKSLSNFVIVTIHWGSELLDWPDKYQRSAAKWLVDNGADLIIGHHPHVIQAPEIIEGKPVFFSLGNHIFDQKYLSTKEGLIVECIIKNGEVNYNGITTQTARNSYFPEILKEFHFNFPELKINQTAKYSDFEIVPISIDNKTDSKIILEGFLNNKKQWQTPAMSLVSISSAAFDKKFNYLFTLETHYSSIDREYGPRPYVYSITKTGLTALWRGSALSRPLLDATLTPDGKFLVALHRGDSFINLNSQNNRTQLETYKWNGFGFSGYKNIETMEYAKKYYDSAKNMTLPGF